MTRHHDSIAHQIHATARLLLILATAVTVVAAEQQPTWQDRPLARWSSPVHDDAAVVEGTTAIRWLPEPYHVAAGASRRYIDFANGDDTRDGLSPATAWQRHPWDPAATGQAAAAQGVHTYVFKGGVIYRGHLIGRESGQIDEPIRLTRDPAWGDGPAEVSGAEVVQGWRLATPDEEAAARIPEASRGKIWTATLGEGTAPRAAWLRHADGRRERLPLARWPNWEIDHPFNHFTQWFRVDEADVERASRWPLTTITAEVLKGYEPDAFDGATIWVNHASSGGMISIIGPFPVGVRGYNPEQGSLRVALTHPDRFPQPQSPFFLENLPRFLDQAGEWTYVAAERRIFARLPDDLPADGLTVEVARHQVILDLVDQQHVEIAGLHFTGGNAMDLNHAPRGSQSGDIYRRPGNFSVMAAIRLSGDVRNVTLRHLVIRDHAGSGIVNAINRTEDATADIVISDSELLDIDNDGIHFARSVGPVHHANGSVDDIRIVRNRIENIGLRCSVEQGGRGINLQGLEVGEIAGNVVHRCAAMGINVVGNRGPLIRIQIHGNQVSEGLLHKNDFGNIEFWGNGPAYVYNNVSIDPVGYFANYGSYHKAEAFYFDHGVKAFLFNNIGWSREWPEARHGVLGHTFFKEVRNRWNQAFHNTAYSFRIMQNMEGKNGQQQHYLANLFIQRHASTAFFSHWGLDEAAGIGYARNLLTGPHSSVFGRERGDAFRDVTRFQEHLTGLGNHVTTDQAAWVSADMPVIDPDARDFRLRDDSPAIDRGVRVFVPWGLYGTVGEWFFRLQPGDPGTVLAYDLYGQAMYAGAAVPENIPFNDLIGPDFTAADYGPGVLEDWNHGALRFDGRRVLRLPQERLITDIVQERRKQDPLVTPGRERATVRVGTGNFLIETVLRVEPDATEGTIAGKIDAHAGYALMVDAQGQIALRLRGDDGTDTVHTGAAVADGRWHHVLTEVDRTAGQVRIYLNGADQELFSSGELPAAEVSLDTEADFVVGDGFRGQLDYLRVCRGTLADARTDIAELMRWQFNGPHLHDFTGRPATGDHRDIGALEHPTEQGERPIRAPEASSEPEATDAFTRLLPGPWLAQMITALPPAPRPQHGHVDPGISDAALAAVQPNTSVDGWTPYQALPNQMWPGFTEQDGEAVFRQQVTVPAAWAGHALVVSLGPVDDFDVTFWNGHEIGRTTLDTPGFWQHPRIYTVPAELVAAGEALIAVRTFDRFGGGGLNARPEEQYIRLAAAPTAGTVSADDDGWLTGPGRRISGRDWGAISVPRRLRPGELAVLQIAFGVETFQTTTPPITLSIDVRDSDDAVLHRLPPQPVTPMDPRPYGGNWLLPDDVRGPLTIHFQVTGADGAALLDTTITIPVEPAP